jgi:hypothetical protein
MPASDFNLKGNLVITNGATITKAAGIVTFSKGGTQTWTDNNASPQDIGSVKVSGTGSSWVLIADAEAASGDDSTASTTGIDTTGANLIIVAVADAPPGSTPTVQDSKSNSWTPLNEYADIGNTQRVIFFYAYNPTVGSGHTFTANGANPSYPGIGVQAWSGAASSPFDQQNGNTAPDLTISTNNVTPTQDNELIVTSNGVGGGAGLSSIDNGFTETADITEGAHNIGFKMAYKTQTTAAAVNPTWTAVDGCCQAANIATFKSANSGTTLNLNSSVKATSITVDS